MPRRNNGHSENRRFTVSMPDRICPENRAYVKWIEKNETFSEEETQLLRAGLTEDALPGATREKLERMGLIRFFGLNKCLEMFSRKLTILL